MSRVSRPIFTVYSREDNSLDDSEFDTTPDLRPVIYVPSSDPSAAPYDPRFFRFDPRQHETGPSKPAREPAPWFEDFMPQQGHADQRERGIRPLAGHSGGDATGQSNALRSVSGSEPPASANVVAIADNRKDDADGRAAENDGRANRPDSPSSGWLSLISHGLIGFWGRWQRRREVSRAIAVLSRLDDRSLRDIGIHHRLQIHERIRSEP